MREENRDKLALFLREKGIYTTFRYYPLHLVKLYNAKIKLPNAEKAANSTICLPIHQSLKEQDLEYIISAVSSFASKHL